MKKHILILSFVLITVIANSQNSIPNGDLENWISGVSEYPEFYSNNSNSQNFFRYVLPFNIERSADSYHGNYALKLTTNGTSLNPSGAYLVNSKYTEGDPPTWHGGVPYTEIPKGIRGYYKYNVATGDKGLLVVSFSKAGASIGQYIFNVEGIHDTYTLFDFTFDPPLGQAPDSVIFAAASSDLFNGVGAVGSILLLDSVNFKGVTSQPANLNGDFESWETETLHRPSGFYTQEQGTTRTTESYAGTYAAKLTTFIGSDKGAYVARSASLSTGYWKESCNCMAGGYPYTETNDKLVFYYKYTPVVPSDEATVNINFKKNMTMINYAGINLPAAASYTYAEIPFDLGEAPDSVIIEIRSSNWENTDISYSGAELTIDEIGFMSQLSPLSVRDISKGNGINIYPNPTNGKFSVELTDVSDLNNQGKIGVFNSTGNLVLESAFNKQKEEIDISGLPEGLYYVKVSNGAVSYSAKVVKRK